MSKTNLVVFPGPSASPATYPVLPQPLYLGRFTASERESIQTRFHDCAESIEKLARDYKVGNSLIQQLIRVSRKPPAISRANDRRGRRAA
jgi:hypothetical protein